MKTEMFSNPIIVQGLWTYSYPRECIIKRLIGRYLPTFRRHALGIREKMFCFGQIWLHTITVFTDFGCGVHKQCPEFSSNNALNVLRGIDMFWTLCKEQYKKYSDIGTTKVGIFQTPMDWIGQKRVAELHLEKRSWSVLLLI